MSLVMKKRVRCFSCTHCCMFWSKYPEFCQNPEFYLVCTKKSLAVLLLPPSFFFLITLFRTDVQISRNTSFFFSHDYVPQETRKQTAVIKLDTKLDRRCSWLDRKPEITGLVLQWLAVANIYFRIKPVYFRISYGTYIQRVVLYLIFFL